MKEVKVTIMAMVSEDEKHCHYYCKSLIYPHYCRMFGATLRPIRSNVCSSSDASSVLLTR